jgi:hypothetical protein
MTTEDSKRNSTEKMKTNLTIKEQDVVLNQLHTIKSLNHKNN